MGTAASVTLAGDLTEIGLYPDESTLYRTYEGTIDGKWPVRAFLVRREERWEGTYYYLDRRLPLQLEDETGIDEEPRSDGRTVLVERPVMDGVEVSGHWEGRFDAEARAFAGTWRSPDGSKTYPFVLRESYAGGSLPGVFYSFSSTWTQARGTDEARREKVVTVAQFAGDSPAVEWINAAIREAATAHFGGGAGSKEANPFADLERAIRAEPIDPDNLEFGLSGHDILHVTIYPVHNDGGHLTVRLYEHSYQGGAHGNYLDRHLTFDTATGRLLDLERDLLKPGTSPLLARAAAAARRRVMGGERDDPASRDPEAEEVFLPDNWFLTAGGIGFSHSPYEVASFAEGFVVYVLPWETVKPWLREDRVRWAKKN